LRSFGGEDDDGLDVEADPLAEAVTVKVHRHQQRPEKVTVETHTPVIIPGSYDPEFQRQRCKNLHYKYLM
jgi:hypothetical protein